MFSGKTTRLYSKIFRYNLAGMRCLLVKYDKDNRGYDTHDGREEKFTYDVKYMSRDKLDELRDISDKYDVIGIDEAQFYDNLKDICIYLRSVNVIVLVSGLISTFKGDMFTPIQDIIPHVDNIKKLSAVCVQCGKQGIYSNRKDTSNNIEMIGGIDLYEPLCHSCFIPRGIL